MRTNSFLSFLFDIALIVTANILIDINTINHIHAIISPLRGGSELYLITTNNELFIIFKFQYIYLLSIN